MITQKIQHSKFKININYPEHDIYRNKVEIVIENTSDEVWEISSPRCYINTIPFLNDINGKHISPVKIKLDSDCLDDFTLINNGEIKKVIYNYSIADLYPNLDSGKYNIHFSYQGEIKNQNGVVFKLDESLNSSKEQIEIVK
ncbi:hypothetical protein [Brumimicrobium aurantiacum]|uniref:Intracellular proteinase inhibitor BsuPI domain-containing protein n=1 Tax=Brumimicrobium aurantiacum TaxID=1737063 RepID=A0A3E1F1B8_9FLAO|nr:hypothetical protein [Brumimicrobium aurantiacum]RFC55608.1 hypothetical protein DXU93_01360 [Brumimicrobium aurantiacum]